MITKLNKETTKATQNKNIFTNSYQPIGNLKQTHYFYIHTQPLFSYSYVKILKMGAETQKLATISFVTDTDVGYYEIGEVEGSFQKEELKDYLKRFGHQKMCSQLAFLQFQVWETLREINSERDNNAKSVCKSGLCGL